MLLKEVSSTNCLVHEDNDEEEDNTSSTLTPTVVSLSPNSNSIGNKAIEFTCNLTDYIKPNPQQCTAGVLKYWK